MNRFDDVLGPENWWDDYVPLEHSVICRLTIRLPDGSTLTKCDAGGYAGMADRGDDDKSGFADAFKRTAVKFGVGRYLYRDGVPTFAREPAVGSDGRESAAGASPLARLTASAGEQQAMEPVLPMPARDRRGESMGPRSGRALFAWTKEVDERHEYGLLQHLNGWGKRQNLPTRMVDWDEEQVGRAYREARRKIRSIEIVENAKALAMAN
jgi:hypothetical protein